MLKANGINKPILLKSQGQFLITQRWTAICLKTLHLFRDHSDVTVYFNSVQQLSQGGSFSVRAEGLDSNHSTAQWAPFPWDGGRWRQASLIHTFWLSLLKFYIGAIRDAATPQKWVPTMKHTLLQWCSVSAGVLNTSRSAQIVTKQETLTRLSSKRQNEQKNKYSDILICLLLTVLVVMGLCYAVVHRIGAYCSSGRATSDVPALPSSGEKTLS